MPKYLISVVVHAVEAYGTEDETWEEVEQFNAEGLGAFETLDEAVRIARALAGARELQSE